MKVLILSCNTGEGHNSSANALKHAMDIRGIECVVQDTLALISETLSRSVSDVYVFSTKRPAFEVAYKIGAFVSDTFDHHKSPIYRTNKLYAKPLYDYIVNNKFDAVVCVHLFPAEAVTALSRKAKLRVPTFFVMTDYTCIPFLTETELNHYIIPHEHLIEEFVEKGLPREKIHPIGIPVDEAKFTSRTEKQEARRLIGKKMHWKIQQATGHWYLIMSGSMGFGNLGELVSELLAKIEANDRVFCVCGRNDHILNSLKKEFADEPQLWLTGFTDKVSLLMDACDVIFTKPGGITSTETIVKNIPLIHTAPIPGLENYNARFFHYHNLSYYTEDILQQVAVAQRLCTDTAYRERMLRAQRENSNPHTSEDIIRLIEKEVAVFKTKAVAPKRKKKLDPAEALHTIERIPAEAFHTITDKIPTEALRNIKEKINKL